MGVMMCYDLIVVDEAPQLFEEHFSRLHEMWRAAGKVSTVFGFRRRRVAAPTGGPHQAKAW
jgi:hypothetical protein